LDVNPEPPKAGSIKAYPTLTFYSLKEELLKSSDENFAGSSRPPRRRTAKLFRRIVQQGLLQSLNIRPSPTFSASLHMFCGQKRGEGN